jgi:hypothetical protein
MSLKLKQGTISSTIYLINQKNSMYIYIFHTHIHVRICICINFKVKPELNYIALH